MQLKFTVDDRRFFVNKFSPLTSSIEKNMKGYFVPLMELKN